MGAPQLKESVDGLPQAPGVYLYRDSRGRVIYIGKAKNLRKRVQSYFTRDLDAKTRAMVARIARIEHILAPSETQAQILEAALIKERQPHYNISLKDDKSFPLIRVSNEAFPLVTVCRARDADRSDRDTYYGPYTSARLLRRVLKMLRRIFGFRSCRVMPSRPCLYYRLRLCPAPCAGRISARRYRENIREIGMFLESRYEQLLERLAGQMREAAASRRYEEAGRIRDQMLALSSIGDARRHCAAADELEDLRRICGMRRLPVRIEGFDIADICGREATGAMVSFLRGHPDKSQYRRFRIKTVPAADDYAMIREVVRRRYSRLLAEEKPLPDLVIIDGGGQHLAAAREELEALRADCALIAIAKEEENIYIKGAREPRRMAGDRPGLNLIRRVRDEAHRFARKYHHLLRTRKMLEE